MSKQSFLTSAEWQQTETALYAIADRLAHDAMDNVLTREPKAICHAAGVMEGLRMAAQWPSRNLHDEDEKPRTEPPGTISIKHAQPIIPSVPRLQDTF